MTVKEAVVKSLLEKEGEVVSGETLSSLFSCSRMAVSKAVQELKNDGYDIEIYKGSGYRINIGDTLKKHTLEHFFKIPVYFKTDTQSTQKDARVLLSSGIEAPFVVVAACQDDGKGRMGRSFFSPEGGLYFSLVLPKVLLPVPTLITLSASLAVTRSLSRLCSVETEIKWVNDVYYNGKKCAGILTEGSVSMEEGGLTSAIIGIGINLSGDSDKIPPELKEIMTFIFQEGKSPVSRAAIAAAITDEIISLQGTDFLDEYRRKCFILGKDIKVLKSQDEYRAKALEINEEGHLIVQNERGEREELSSGEVSLNV